MSIQTELTRITNAKTAIKAAIEGKGVTVPDGTLLDGMASLIESIEAGGGGVTGNIATGSYTLSFNMTSFVIMTTDEWQTNYGDFPTTLYAAFFEENPDEITSGYYPLYCASCLVDGNAKECYATVYINNQISYVKKTTAIVLNSSNGKVLISGVPDYAFKSNHTYRWVIIW